MALLAVGLGVSIRNVEFSGDMEPTFDFVWHQSRESKLDAYLDQEVKNSLPIEAEAVNIAPQPSPEDSPTYRGLHCDGVVEGPALARDWQRQPPKCLWRHPCGGGYAGFAVVGDRAVTIEQRGDNEVVVCYDVTTGHQHWTYAYPALFSERPGRGRTGTTPAIDQGRVYSLGATGDLVKLDLATGYLIWKVNILARNGSLNLQWGMSGSPLIHAGRVLVNPGSQQGKETSADVLALDIADGEILAAGGRAQASYCSPMLATLLGSEQVLIFDAAGLAGFASDDLRELWRVPWTSDFDINAAQPILLDDRRIVFSSQSGCALIELAVVDGQWTANEVWRNQLMKCSYANPIVYDGYLYGLDQGTLGCLDLANGKRRWKDRKASFGHGQLLASDDLLLVLSEKGELALVQAAPDAFHELGRIQAIDGKTWNNPVLVRGRALVRNHIEMACYELPLADPTARRDAPPGDEQEIE